MEAIIAVGIIVTVIITALGLGIYTTRVGRTSQNRIIAMNLAREGIEVVRNIRDSNWLKREQGVTHTLPVLSYTWRDYISTSDQYKVGLVVSELNNCPNNTRNAKEECDDGNLDETDNCTTLCLLATPEGTSNLSTPFWEITPLTEITINACATANTCQLYLDSNKIYNHNATGQASGFYRMIDINYDVVNNKIDVTARVIWKENNRWLTPVALQEQLYDWRYE